MSVDLRLGDCLEILPTLPDKSVDAIITDIPYGVGKADWDSVIPPPNVWKEMRRIIKDKSPLVVFSGLKYMPNVIASVNSLFDYEWIFAWYKSNAMQFGKTGFSVLDVALWFSSGGMVAKNKKRDVIVQAIIPSQNNFGHPTPKPEKVMAHLIECVTKEGDVILDPFMGSGTTGVAGVKMGRGFIGIDKELPYFDIASRRIAEAQQQMVMAL